MNDLTLPRLVAAARHGTDCQSHSGPSDQRYSCGNAPAVVITAASARLIIGATVISTTRHANRAGELRAMGVDHPVVDDGRLAEKVRDLVPQGVDAALELVGCTVLPDTFGCVRVHGTVCFTGALAGGWSIPGFSPFLTPSGVRLTSYAGQAADLPSDAFARQLQALAEGRFTAPVAKVYHGLEQVHDAQADVESGAIPGKHVVVLND
ncbi:zinc-binding dehydrogenase [Nonomuraea sp. NPDC046802]|uniref:zinc-binding dehydrogenase n=1 Tax=Nonomuraea sp. NPDC046802 TaxID=3154919 RepID=UPI0033E728DE